MVKLLKINEQDNVAVAIQDIAAKETASTAEGVSVTALEDIGQGHKIALQAIAKGENVVKYGFPIGHTLADIPTGAWVHTHNTATNLGEVLHYSYHPKSAPLPPQLPRQFMGYHRPNGQVGVRNEIWIIPTVGCVNSVVQRIEKLGQQYVTGSIDGIYSFVHPHGCSQMGSDQENLQRILAGLINNPNAAAVLVVGLGCEYNQIDLLKPFIGPYDEERVKFMVCQDFEDETEEGLRLLEELAGYASRFTRQPADASSLVVGLKCGGSDGFSGITANPLVGSFSDCLIAQGGSTILTEVPEMFGAETLLMERCQDEATFDKTVNLINRFKEYLMSYHQVIYENPSPVNKKGGITTLEDKSLGCTQKGGRAPVVDVLYYGDPVKAHGLHLCTAPGNDLVASTTLAASGAQIILFTTGRGTPFGAPVPTVKISTNTRLYEKKKNWIDFNAGQLVEGKPMAQLTDEFFDYILRLASGEVLTRTEENGIREITIFKDGVTL